jgi:hypothetical protein
LSLKEVELSLKEVSFYGPHDARMGEFLIIPKGVFSDPKRTSKFSRTVIREALSS